ncbi:SRPBCC family protein [Actinomadura flavalba]|uniref:SRPBCC family protein n=1 Tax=Actinomadura flavalba TaxID=1120938 RepID=UPI000360E389|nr:SRPBCC domain-containing protein [Actinomadura flavalba]
MTAPLRLRARVEAPATDVWRAITDAEALRVWLAEHAEVDLPRAFSFWGRYTPEGDVPRQRPLHTDSGTLRFAWSIGGAETTVEISVTDEGPGCAHVVLTQTHVPDWRDVVREKGARSVLATFWSLSIANLVDYVEGRPLTPRCDFTSPRLADCVVVAGPPEEVFDSLVDPDKIRNWLGAVVDVDLREGGHWHMDGADTGPSAAKVLSLEPGRRVELDWGSFASTWELEGSGGRTRLTFVHSRFNDGGTPYAGWLGWLSGMAELRRFHERRPSIWLESTIPGAPGGAPQPN